MFVQTTFIPYYLSTDIDFVCVLCTSSSTAAVASLSFPLSRSLSLFKGTSHNIAISLPTLLLRLCLYKRHSFPTSLLARIILRFVTTGLILCTPLRQIDIFPTDRGMLRRSRRLQIFSLNNNSTTVTTTNIRSEAGYCPPARRKRKVNYKRSKPTHVVNCSLR